MVEEFADLRPKKIERYKENAEFLNESKDKERLAEEYHRNLDSRLFNYIFSKDSLVALKEDKAVIDSEAVREVLYGLRDNAKSERSFEETPFYKPIERVKRRAFRDGYNWVRGKDRPHGIVQAMFSIPEEVDKREFTPKEVEEVLEGEETINATKAFKDRERHGIINNQNLLYDASPDQLAGAMFTAITTQRAILFHRSFSTTALFSGIALGGYACYSAADAKASYDEGIKKGVEDELHELGSWMKMEQLEGKEVKIETGNVPDLAQLKLGREPFFDY